MAYDRRRFEEDLGSRIEPSATGSVNRARELAAEYELPERARAAATTARQYMRKGSEVLDDAIQNIPGYNPTVGKNTKHAIGGAAVTVAAMLLPLPGPNFLIGLAGLGYATWRGYRAFMSIGKDSHQKYL